jgi:glycosyltransferase involved in cell wall biosynthesis
VAISESILEWGFRDCMRKKTADDQVFYLGYHEPNIHGNLDNVGKDLLGILDAVDDKTVVSYVGTSSVLQDPSIIVNCARKIDRRDIAFVITGYGDFYENIKEDARSQPNVYFPGWLNGDEIDALLVNSSIGICPYAKPANMFSNKVLTYLSAGLPVVSSFHGEIKEIIESEELGYNFNPGDVDALCDAIMSLVQNPSVYDKMSQNAKRIFRLRFDEERIYQDFADHIEKITVERSA